MKNIFVPTHKIIAFGSGKIQFNKSTPEFRTRVQMFADGMNTIANAKLECAAAVKIQKARLDLENKKPYVDGEKIAEIEGEIAAYQSAYEKVCEDEAKAAPVYDDTDKRVFYAYKQYHNGEIDEKVYIRAVAEWLDNGGIVPTIEGIKFIVGQIGKKAASAKTMCKSGGTQFTDVLTEKPFLKMFYRVIAEVMYKNNCLKPFVYTYEIPTKTKNTTK